MVAVRTLRRPGSFAASVDAEAGRRREALRADALRMLVEALLGRAIDRDRESSVSLALELSGALRRTLPAKAGGIGESLRETALRRLVEAVLKRALEPGENAVGLALELSTLRSAGGRDAG